MVWLEKYCRHGHSQQEGGVVTVWASTSRENQSPQGSAGTKVNWVGPITGSRVTGQGEPWNGHWWAEDGSAQHVAADRGPTKHFYGLKSQPTELQCMTGTQFASINSAIWSKLSTELTTLQAASPSRWLVCYNVLSKEPHSIAHLLQKESLGTPYPIANYVTCANFSISHQKF